MFTKKLIVLTIAIFCVMSLNIAFAKKSSKLTKEDLIAVLEDLAKDGNVSGEVVKEESGDVEISGEAVEPTSGEATEPVSGEVVEATSGEFTEPASGEVVEAVSGEATEPTSGDAAEAIVSGEDATSGEVLASGEDGRGDLIINANDVDDDKWYAPYVNDILEKGIMDLDEEGNFNPKNKVTKADVVEAVYNLPGLKSGDEKEWAKETAIVAEGEDLSAEATREDVAVMVYNYVKSYGGGFTGTWMFMLGYDDRDEISEDGYEAVAWCVMNDIIIGKTDDTLNIKDVATRAELATIIYRLANIK
ncbi:MAG: S-layer homology domain-containing protein [Clostridia bacterium]|nr:S-layer homology domain-containing protein [Clostridia bacterium]